MSKQLHKRRTTVQVVDIVRQYQHQDIKAKEAAAYLGVGRTRFYQIVAAVAEHGSAFTLDYHRRGSNNRLDPAVEKNLRRELVADRKLIEHPDVPVKRYNYTYLQGRLQEKNHQKVSVTTIINRAKKWGFYLGKPARQKHDRQVLTNYTGELIQHDASYHLFVPLLGDKLVLTTSLDDY